MYSTIKHIVTNTKRGITASLLVTVVILSFSNNASSQTAYFTVDRVSGCAHHTTNFPVLITDESVGATSWRYTITNNSTSVIIFDQSYIVQPAPFTHIFINNSPSFIEFTIELTATAGSNVRTYSRLITVYPSIRAQFTRTYIGDACANPRVVEFNRPSIINPGTDTYYWTLGDGTNRISTATQELFTHSYENLTAAGVNYNVRLVAQSQFGCRDTANAQAYVTSRFVPQFDVNHTEGCGPLFVDVTNRSVGNIVTSVWNISPNPGGPALPDNGANFARTLPNTSANPINYTISLAVTNTDGCPKTFEQVVTVYPQVRIATFIPENISVCDSAEVQFTTTLNPALLNVSYSWNFNDGASSTQQNPLHIFRNTGDAAVPRNVTLTATSQYGCFDGHSTTITVHPKIRASFSVSDAEICSGEDITFTYLRMNSISNYQWDFMGYTDNVKPPDAPLGTFVKNFVNQSGAPMPVDVRLRTTNIHPTGCPKEKIVPITINPEVTAGFTWVGDSPNGCNPLEVTFTNTTLFTGGGVFNGTYYWDFGDGSTSTEVNPTHVFLNDNPDFSDTYTVRLTATSVHGCVHFFEDDITVQPRLTAGFSIEQPDICVPEFVITPSSPGATSYSWNFGALTPIPAPPVNGVPFTVTLNPIHPDIPTVDVITLTVQNALGCSGVATRDIVIQPTVIPIFTPSVNVDCSDLEVTLTNTSTGGTLVFDWDFDNGQTFTTPSEDPFVHTFVNRGTSDRTFNVRLTAENPNGCRVSTTLPIRVHPKVEAKFTFAVDDVCEYPLPVTFTNASLYGTPVGNNTTFHWDYGYTWLGVPQEDSFNSGVPHQYSFFNAQPNAAETYQITLTVSQFHAISGLTCVDDTSRTLEVYPEVVPIFSVDVDEGCNPLTVQFTNSSTGLGTFQWNFDDGTTTGADSPLKIFSHPSRVAPETFTVRLTSTNELGCSNSATHDIFVYPLVESAFTIDEDDGCTPLTIQINNSKVSPAYVYSWDFGDGQNSTDAQPVSVTIVNPNVPPLALEIFEPTIFLETRLNPGVYPEGCPETFSREVMVYPHIFPEFSADFSGCHPHPVDFTNETEAYLGIDNATYLWTFGNGVESNFTHFSQNYYNASVTQDTTYAVTLRAYSEHGCADSVSYDVTVHPKPQSRMELLSGYFACSPYEVEIQNLSEGKNFGTTLNFDFDFGDGDDLNTFSGNNVFHLYPSNLIDDVESYLITLLVETEDGCLDTSYQTIYIYPEVQALFSFDPGDAACNPFLVQMENNSVNGFFFQWDFDDGTLSNLYEPNHLFINNSTLDREFNVTLTAVSVFECVHSVTLPVTVYAAPVADFIINPPLKVFPDADFAFVNLTNPADPGWTYYWTFGDGYDFTGINPPPHTYETWGPPEEDFQYFVTLYVNNDNCADTIQKNLILRPARPVALYTPSIRESCSPLIVYFVNNSQFADTYLWDFGDGITSTEFEPNHTFVEPGYYNVSLTVWGDGGDREYFSVFRVYENPVAMFAVAPQRVSLPEARVHMYNLSTDADEYIWDFGDGSLPPYRFSRDPVHTYNEIGEFRVSLTVYTEYGCMDSTSMFPAVWVEGAGQIRFPNAFMPSKLGPNGGFYDEIDYRNEVFHPVADGVGEFRLLIFNRWGEQIFESKDIKIGWDGYYQGKLCAQDVYVWRAVGKYINGRPFDLKGNVTLFR